MKLITIFILFFIISCATSLDRGSEINELFIGLDQNALSLDEKRVINESSEDYFLVLKGKKPIHAKLDENRFVLDGGTRFYDGYKYRLTIVMSMSNFGQVNGYVYGPSIQYEDGFAPGNVSKLSSLKMYTPEALRKLLSMQ